MLLVDQTPHHRDDDAGAVPLMVIYYVIQKVRLMSRLPAQWLVFCLFAAAARLIVGQANMGPNPSTAMPSAVLPEVIHRDAAR